ncbi:hypothetical protein [Mesorhizobium cantuariense]|uniref:Uncharacterized protein n=1 Tax=Mesorhizobium cantuariense TaxID=1300275 RepID=A0ABV7MJS3_9HYPH
MLELLRPLSALSKARFYMASESITAAVKAPVVHRTPLAEEHSSGRLSARHITAADWFSADIEANASVTGEGVMRRNSSGSMAPSGSRDPLALWPAEAAADASLRIRLRFRTLGRLANVVVAALQGGEMRDLAPAWNFSQRNKADAGRIRLRAALEICARMAEREVDWLPRWEVTEIAQAACSQCSKLEATRRMRVLRPANDNYRMLAAA